MIYSSSEGPIDVPATDIVSFCFDKQNDYNEDKPILFDADEPSRHLSYAQYQTLVRRLIAGWKAHGLENGDSVLCLVGNTYLYPAMYFSIVGASGVWCGANPANQHHEIEHYIKLGEPKFIVAESSMLEKLLPVTHEAGIDDSRIFILDINTFPLYINVPSSIWAGTEPTKPAQSTRSFTELLCHGEQDWRRITTVEEAKTTPAVHFSTSGTTGLPKLAMVSHWNMIAHHLILHQDTPYQARRMLCLPFFHLFATSFAFVQPIRYGQVTYIMKRWNLEKYLIYHERYEANEAYMAPPMLIAMIQTKLDVRKHLKRIRYAGVGGAPCDAVSINKFRGLLTNATMTCMWGMTEIGIASLFRLGENDESGSVGRLMRGMEGKLVDVDGKVVTKEGEPGELYCRTEGIMLGYRNMEMSEDEKQWYRTGDVCCFRDGKIYIVGRAKELIKVKGWQVAPAELEAVLLQHPDIVDAAVCGTMHTNGVDEVPKAYVIRAKKLHTSDLLTAEEVYQFSRTRLASYKALDGGVCFVEEIPRTASGKIQRAKLAKMDTYRRSVTAVLLSSGTSGDVQEKIQELKDAVMVDVKDVTEEVTEKSISTIKARSDEQGAKNVVTDRSTLRGGGLKKDVVTVTVEETPRRSTRLSLHKRGTSTSSSELLALGKLRMGSRRKGTTRTSSSSEGRSVSPTAAPAKVVKKESKRDRLKRLVKAVQATAV